MMSLGSGRRANSSTSHLSPTAVPFSSHDSSCCPWQNAHLPTPKPDPLIPSSETMSLPLRDAYRFSPSIPATPSTSKGSTHKDGFGNDTDPYASYSLPFDAIESLFSEDEGCRLTSRLGTISTHSLLGPPWVDNLGLDDVKLAKRADFDGKLSSRNQYVGALNGYDSQPYRGNLGDGNKLKKDEGVPYKSLNPVYGQAAYAGYSSSIGYMDSKPRLNQLHGLSLYPESAFYASSGAMQKDLPSYQKSCGPYEQFLMPAIAKTTLPGCVSSQLSKLDSEAGNNDLEMDSYRPYDFGYGRHLPTIDFMNVERNKGKENECGRNGVTVSMGKPIETVCSTRETIAKIVIPPTTVVKGADLRGEEKVLAPLDSQQDAEMDVPAIVQKIHRLSELLQVRMSSDMCSLGQENSETLKHVLTNLNICLSKEAVKSEAPNNRGTKDALGETLAMLDESPNKGVTSGGHQSKCDLRDDLTQDDDMAKDIQKVLEQNFLTKEFLHSEALLFKSMWLESEAKLCSTRCKARFEQMRFQMEEIKEIKLTKGPTSFDGIGLEPSLLARFNMLKSQEENPDTTEEKEQPEMVGSELAEKEYEALDVAMHSDSHNLVSVMIDSYFGRVECESPIVSNKSAVHSDESSNTTIDARNSNGNCSTEWEHVLEEDLL